MPGGTARSYVGAGAEGIFENKGAGLRVGARLQTTRSCAATGFSANWLWVTLRQPRPIVDCRFISAKWRFMEIRVEGSLDQAMRVLKRKLAKEGVFKEMKKRAFYEKPSVRRKRKRSEAQRRRRKEQRRRRASAL